LIKSIRFHQVHAFLVYLKSGLGQLLDRELLRLMC
jgi:hypothetical protein